MGGLPAQWQSPGIPDSLYKETAYLIEQVYLL